jgi:acyl carrier protein
MNEDHVYEVVKKHLLLIVRGIDESQIVPSKSLRELGADSIDMVEVLSACMRDLRIKVSRTELTTSEDVQGLVDLLRKDQAAESGT